jgi:predicted nucleotidyltransferase/DNA-binding XRE family transcriptional regulator
MGAAAAEKHAARNRPHPGLAGDLLRRARQKRGMSQRALAAAAGVSHTVVARIESGKTQPTLTTLAKLLAGADYEPTVELVSTARPSTVLAAHKDEVLRLAERYRVRWIQVFGSVAMGTDEAHSDLDLFVEYEPDAHWSDQVNFPEALEDLLGVSVDQVTPTSANDRFTAMIRHQLRPLDEF